VGVIAAIPEASATAAVTMLNMSTIISIYPGPPASIASLCLAFASSVK